MGISVIGAVIAFSLLWPMSIPFVVYLTSRPYRIARQKEAARLVAEFHERFNAGDFDAICRHGYNCTEFPNVRQDWQSALEETRSRGGLFQCIVQSDIRVYIEPPAVRAIVVSSFEKGELREIFDMHGFDGPLQIETYKVAPEEPAVLAR